MILFIPVVSAKDDIIVKSITLVDSSSDSIVNDKNKVDVTFNDLEQLVRYKVVFRNNTDTSMYIQHLKLLNTTENWIQFNLDQDSINKELKPEKDTAVTFTIKTLKTEMAGRNFYDNAEVQFTTALKVNPATNSNILSILFLLICFVILFLAISKKVSNKGLVSIILCFVIFGSGIKVLAESKLSVILDGKVSFVSQNLVDSTGIKVMNYTVNSLDSKEVWVYRDLVKNIFISSKVYRPGEYIKKLDLTINDNERVYGYLVNNGDKNVPYDLHVVSRGVIYAPEDATGLFSFPNVEKIEGLEHIDFSNTKIMKGMFMGDKKLTDVNFDKFNSSNATDTSYMFYECYGLKKDDIISKLNLDRVSDKRNMFPQYLYDVVINDDVVKYKGSVTDTYNRTVSSANNVYFYRGGVIDNNVVFGNYCWKMVRTTENKGVKLIFNGEFENGLCNKNGADATIGTSVFNPKPVAAEHVKYVLNDGSNSSIKSFVDNWYKSKLINYTELLENVVWCNDTTEIQIADKTAPYYAAYKRVNFWPYTATLKCNRENSIVSTYPIGLLTADEAILSGNIPDASTIGDTYLSNGTNWWTMTPRNYANGTAAIIYKISSNGTLLVDYGHSGYKVRPMISLNSSIDYNSGDGTVNNPYIVNMRGL